MDPNLKAMLTEAIQVAPYTGQNAYGQPTYGPGVTYQGRIDRHYQTQAVTTGAQLVLETVLWLDETAVIDERSQVTLPDGRVAPIQGLKVLKDEFGVTDHFQVYF